MPTLGEIRSFLTTGPRDESERAIRLRAMELAIEIMKSVEEPLGLQRDLTQVQDAFQAVKERLRFNADDSRAHSAHLLAQALHSYWSYWEVKPQLEDSVFDPVFAQCATCHACWMTGYVMTGERD